LSHEELIHIVAVADNNYIQHLGVTFTSLLIHKSPKRMICLHVIDGGISQMNQQLLRQSLDKFGVQLRIITIDTEIYHDVIVNKHITKATYYRLSIPDLFAGTDVKKVIYLDCDLIVKDDISKMWDIDLVDHTIGAVGDFGGLFLMEGLGIPQISGYFNAGVLIIDLTKWTENQITDRVLRFIDHNRDILQYHDQDGLNAILHNQWLSLPPKWNMQRNMLHRNNTTFFSTELLNEAILHPSIIHFTGSSKPWQFDNTHAYKREYYEYLQMTAWSSYIPKKNIKIIIKRVLKEILPEPFLLFLIKLKSFSSN
jgi:lipopolysaccharide biosynthesis glycosyltransferase